MWNATAAFLATRVRVVANAAQQYRIEQWCKGRGSYRAARQYSETWSVLEAPSTQLANAARHGLFRKKPGVSKTWDFETPQMYFETPIAQLANAARHGLFSRHLAHSSHRCTEGATTSQGRALTHATGLVGVLCDHMKRSSSFPL